MKRFACLVALATPLVALARDAKLTAGLVATYHDGAGNEVVRVDPTIAFHLRAGESPHPGIAADGFTATWDGALTVLEGGKYRFSGYVLGGLQLELDGKPAFAANVATPAPLRPGDEVELTAGAHSLHAEFRTAPVVGAGARLQFWWEGPSFSLEPLPARALSHKPEQEPPALKANEAIERGQLLVEEFNCASCHAPSENKIAAKLASRKAPDLSAIGSRANPEWIYAWLADPQQFRHGALMPSLFGDDEGERAERYAVTQYLTSLKGPPMKTGGRDRGGKSGQEVFNTVGCFICHGTGDDRGRTNGRVPLAGLGSKWEEAQLAQHLKYPPAIDPSGRMPAMNLHDDELNSLATYLCASRINTFEAKLPPAPNAELTTKVFRAHVPEEEARKDFDALDDAGKQLALGKRIVQQYGCLNCHSLTQNKKPGPSIFAGPNFEAIRNPQKTQEGCLAEKPTEEDVPKFTLTDAQRADIRAFLAAASGAGSPSPMHELRMAFARFHCLDCHTRDGQGGLSPDALAALQKVSPQTSDEEGADVEAISPPPLTGVAMKLKPDALQNVLLRGARARPWMLLHMPQFGDANVGALAEALIAADGADFKVEEPAMAFNADQIESARQLIGGSEKGGFKCIQCHDFSGRKGGGARGPDMTRMRERVRYEWFVRWLHDPQRIAPGTRMPQFFANNVSPLKSIAGGNVDAQIKLMWDYLSLGSTAPMPEGLSDEGSFLVLVKDQPVILRCFLPDAGARAIAVGFPERINFAFDAENCRLCFAWWGDFLDASGAWKDRGGSNSQALGTRIWQSVITFPWTFSASGSAPDWTTVASKKNGALHWKGYTLSKTGTPTFLCAVDLPAGGSAQISESPAPAKEAGRVAFSRMLEVRGLPKNHDAWFLAAQTPANQPPKLIGRDGKEIAGSIAKVSDLARITVNGLRAYALSARDAPPNAEWVLARDGDKGPVRVLLRLPSSGPNTPARATVVISIAEQEAMRR